MSIFNFIGAFFVGLFSAAKKAYLKLSPEEQIALQAGTGIVAVINGMLDQTVANIRQAIQSKFPNQDEKAVEGSLIELGNVFFKKTYTDGDAVIADVKDHLSAKEGKAWAFASHAFATALSLIFAPPSTKLATITSLIEWAYQHFHKKSTEDHAPEVA